MGAVEPRVTLLYMTPDAERVVAGAARLCYAASTEDLFEGDAHDDAALIRRIIKMGHLSPIEHASFTFLLEGVSRAMTHQLVRHRIASYSQRSQRYVGHDAFDYIVPPRFEGKEVEVDGKRVDAAAYFAETMDLIAERYARLNDALGRAGERSNEDARYVLPNACETKIVVTMNARELRHFFGERICQRAQWEIRRVADAMLTLVKKECPALFAGVGPKCVQTGGCTEGKMSCGHYAEMRSRYAEPREESK